MITGISLTIKVGPAGWSDSKDTLYLGIFGKDGGREFALDVDNYEEFDSPNKIVKLRIGNGCCPDDSELQVRHSDQYGGSNTPLIYPLDLEDIEYVYLRKIQRMRETPTGNPDDQFLHDDLLELASVDVLLCDSNGSFRRFQKNHKIFFGSECGVQHWLEETNKIPGCRIIVQIDTVHYGGDNIGKKIKYNLKSFLNGGQQQYVVNEGKHKFKKGETETHYKSVQYFQKGCCNNSNKIKLVAFVKEYDPFNNDTGDETLELTVNCTEEQQVTPFTIVVNVHAMFNKVANFTFKGKITTICENK
jgi:hypothetical protein